MFTRSELDEQRLFGNSKSKRTSTTNSSGSIAIGIDTDEHYPNTFLTPSRQQQQQSRDVHLGHAATPSLRSTQTTSRSNQQEQQEQQQQQRQRQPNRFATSLASNRQTSSGGNLSMPPSILPRSSSSSPTLPSSGSSSNNSSSSTAQSAMPHDYFTSAYGKFVHKVVSVLLACIISLVYLSTMYQTVPGGDSGELIVASYQWAVAHPPGYPLFVTLGHLANLLLDSVFGSISTSTSTSAVSFCGSVACRVGLVSVASNVVASLVIFWLVTHVYFPDLQFGPSVVSHPKAEQCQHSPQFSEFASGISRIIVGATVALLFALRYKSIYSNR
jgi:hypothetical protein